jgi:glycosyltransferase involved in cell wall biosynthesis
MLQTPALEETTVVTINYNSIDVIANCLEPLLEAKEIIVVDNDSTDESLAMIAERFPSVRIMATGKNGGIRGRIKRWYICRKEPVCIVD